jgi:CheY-like chemotaxis protein
MMAVSLDSAALVLRYLPQLGSDASAIFGSVLARLAQRLHWQIISDDLPDGVRQLTLHMTAERTTILVIDDNSGWTELLGRFLAGYDCMVIAASLEQDALQQVQEINPTALILDVMMPGRDGWELLQRLRSQPVTADLPIIVCTVFNDPQLAYSLGASAFVLKPANREKILEVLGQLGII